MFKTDIIFWSASAIFIAALGIFMITGDQSWLTLMIGSYLLRPTLASLGIGRTKIDERQMTIHYRSGNIAFAAMMVTCVILAITLYAEGNHAFELFAMVILIGLATKALFNVVLVRDFKNASSKIITSVGLLIAVFGFLEGSPPFQDKLMDALPGSVIAVIGILSGKFPKPMGTLIYAIALFLIIMIFNRGFNRGSIGTALIVGVPLTIAGIYLFRRNTEDIDSPPGHEAWFIIHPQ